MRIGVCVASRLGVFTEPDATARCDALLHDTRIELDSIQVFFSGTTRRITYIVNIYNLDVNLNGCC